MLTLVGDYVCVWNLSFFDMCDVLPGVPVNLVQLYKRISAEGITFRSYLFKRLPNEEMFQRTNT